MTLRHHCSHIAMAGRGCVLSQRRAMVLAGRQDGAVVFGSETSFSGTWCIWGIWMSLVCFMIFKISMRCLERMPLPTHFRLLLCLFFEWPRGQGESAAGRCTFGIGHVAQLLGWNSNVKPTSAVLFLPTWSSNIQYVFSMYSYVFHVYFQRSLASAPLQLLQLFRFGFPVCTCFGPSPRDGGCSAWQSPPMRLNLLRGIPTSLIFNRPSGLVTIPHIHVPHMDL